MDMSVRVSLALKLLRMAAIARILMSAPNWSRVARCVSTPMEVTPVPVLVQIILKSQMGPAKPLV